MRILSVSLDAAILDPTSTVAKRQIAYFEGHTGRILVLAPGTPKEVLLTPNLQVERIGGSSKVVCLGRALRRMRSLPRGSYDLILSQDVLYTGLCAYLASCRVRAPYAVQLHGDYLFNPYWTKERWINSVFNTWGLFLLRRAAGIRVVSQRIRRELVRREPALASRLTVFPIGTEIKHFSPHGPKAMEVPYVLFVGRLHPEKTPFRFCDVAIRLLRAHPDMRAIMVGEGPLRKDIEERFAVAGLSERVRLTGRQTPGELAAWYRGAVCLIHPSDWDGWGMVMIEAMACGCPVVTTDSGAAHEAVRDEEQGLVVPVGDTDGLVGSVERLLEDHTLRERLSHASMAEAQNWSFEATVRAYHDWYERLIPHA